MRTMSSRRRPFSDGSSIKDVHSEGGRELRQKWTNVDMGRGGGIPATMDHYTNLCESLLLGNMAQKWATVTLFYGIMNLVLHSNFD